MSDTARDVEERMRRMLSERTPGERLRMCTGMFSTAKALARAGIHAQRGALDECELPVELFRRFYAADFRVADRMAIVQTLRHTPVAPAPRSR